MSQKIRKAIFPVGGLGTRFLPATKAVPKEMLPVFNKPLVQYAYEEAKEAGIEEFVFVTGRNKNAINNHFDHNFELQSILVRNEKPEELSIVKDWLPESGHLAFIPQTDPKGLGHAIWCARHFIGNEPFAIILPDEMVLNKGNGVLKQMVQAYGKCSENIIAVAEVARKDTKKYGIIEAFGNSFVDNLLPIKSMIEKPEPEKAPSNLSIIGRYILSPSIFTYLENDKDRIDGEIQLTDAMVKMLEKEKFYGFRFEGKRYDCGNPVGFLEANIAYAIAEEDLQGDVRNMLKSFI